MKNLERSGDWYLQGLEFSLGNLTSIDWLWLTSQPMRMWTCMGHRSHSQEIFGAKRFHLQRRTHSFFEIYTVSLLPASLFFFSSNWARTFTAFPSTWIFLQTTRRLASQITAGFLIVNFIVHFSKVNVLLFQSHQNQSTFYINLSFQWYLHNKNLLLYAGYSSNRPIYILFPKVLMQKIYHFLTKYASVSVFPRNTEKDLLKRWSAIPSFPQSSVHKT